MAPGDEILRFVQQAKTSIFSLAKPIFGHIDGISKARLQKIAMLSIFLSVKGQGRVSQFVCKNLPCQNSGTAASQAFMPVFDSWTQWKDSMLRPSFLLGSHITMRNLVRLCVFARELACKLAAIPGVLPSSFPEPPGFGIGIASSSSS